MSVKEIRFSIIVPTFNRANLITKTLESALNQNYSNYEIIVVDDGGTDNTQEIVEKIGSEKIIFVKKTKNQERSAARNTGTQNSSGDYLYFLDSDDIIYSNHLSAANTFIQMNNHPEFIIPKHEIINENNIKNPKSFDYKGDLNKRIIEGNFIGCMFFLRKDIALKHPFNENRLLSSGSEDYELCLRLASRYKIHLIDAYTCAFVNHNKRSVLNVNLNTLKGRMTQLEYYLFMDKPFINIYGKYLKQFQCDNLTYIALHLSITKNHKKEALKYLLKSLLMNPLRAISTLRFYVTIYKILFFRLS
ncbi:MAG: glycosyltransferase family A protein [Bacteroidota bacterium]|nr:glycosyltransferase family A protein [Bacteroidota bacterium]